MKLYIKASTFGIRHNADGSVNIEMAANMEDVFDMIDGIKPRVLADYLARRMKPEEHHEARLVNTLASEEGGAL